MDIYKIVHKDIIYNIFLIIKQKRIVKENIMLCKIMNCLKKFFKLYVK